MRHPFVAAAENGPRFGLLLTGAKGLASPTGPDHGWLIHDKPTAEIQNSAGIAEELGFDVVFVPETPRLFPDPAVMLAALAMKTSTIWLGSLVIVPPFRHPSLLARQLADIDHLSQGRLIAGFGVGESERQYATVDAKWDDASGRQDSVTEAIEMMMSLWTGVPLTYFGTHWQADDMQVAQGSWQKPRPPILIAGSGDRTLEMVVRQGDISNLFGGPSTVVDRLAKIDDLCDRVSRPRNEILRSYYDLPILAPTVEQAEAKLKACLSPDVIERRGKAGLLVVGTPEMAIEHYRKLIEQGIELFAMNLPDTADHETLELLGQAVIPALKS